MISRNSTTPKASNMLAQANGLGNSRRAIGQALKGRDKTK